MSGINLEQFRSSKKTEPFRSFMQQDIELFGSGLGDKKKERMYNELGILLSSGVDIKTALEMLEQEQSGKKDRLLVQEIREAVISGKSLSAAFRHSGKFSPYEFYSLEIGEETGKIVEVLDQMTTFFGKKVQQKRQVINAFSYPAIVMATAFGAVFFMLNYMVPMFGDVFKRFGGDLPDLTKMIMAFAEIFSANFPYLVIALLILVVVMITQRKQVWFRKLSSSMLLKTWVIGGMVDKIYMGRFCTSMALLMGARVPMIRAIELMEQMIGFYPVEEALASIKGMIMKGRSLHESMQEFPVFGKRMVSLVKVGEEVNQLEAMFSRMSQQYTDEVEYQTGLISSLLEPVMIIFLGLVVGIILVAMYLPLFELSLNFR